MEIGQTLNQRYTLVARLGQGAMGTVYRATDAQTSQDVAVKVLNRDLALSGEILERFRREGEALRQLRHPNIVGFVDMFTYDDQNIIVMEYVPGGNLHHLIKRGPLPVDRARRIALGLCDALTRAHELNIIHRDIKPENILLAADGAPKLTDFGVARLVSEGTRLTGTGTQVGTPFYMAPEAWEGSLLDAQADIWALGVVLFEMLTGQVPFSGETVIVVMHKVLNAPLPEVRELRGDVPPGLARIVAGMLTRDKAQRYASIRRVAADLEQGESTVVARPTVAVRASPAPRRWPTWAALAGIAVVIVVVVALSLLQFAPGLVPGRQTSATPAAARLAATLASTVPPPSVTRASTQAPLSPKLATLEEGQRLVTWGGDVLLGDTPGHYTPLGLAAKFVNIMGLTWSPDGQRLAFTACLPGEIVTEADKKKCNVLYVARRDGSEVTKVAPLKGVLGLAWSPNGEWLAYGDGSLNLIRPDGSGQRQIIQASDTWGTWNAPAWSPDSQWLAYRINRCKPDGCDTARSIAVVGEGGGPSQTIFELATAQLGYGGPMAWSPDAGSVVAADENGGAYQIWIDCLKTPGGCTTPPRWVKIDQVPPNWLPDFYPQWTPDQIAPVAPAGQARAFADPILTAIANLPPDYTDDFSRPDSGWPVANSPVGDEFGYQAGAFVVSNLNLPCRGGGSTSVPLASDFVLTVDTRFVSGAGEWMVVYRAASDGRAAYGVHIASEGITRLSKNVGGVHIQILDSQPIPASAFNRGNAVNRLTLIARGAYVAVFLNDEPLDLIEDHSSSKGGIQLLGCVRGGSSQPLRVAFDNLKLWDLTRVSALR